MVVGSYTSVFGWSPETKSVVAEKEVWKAYVKASSAKSGNLGKRVRASDNLVKGLSEVASILGREIRAASSNISRVIDFDVELSEKRSKLNEELANLGLTNMERHRAVRKIASEPMYFSVSLMPKGKSGCKLFFKGIFTPLLVLDFSFDGTL
ncbi:hypothetical protein Cgig2_018857 [Carnegiea gigantea]|uniref:Uncharacterized protein n=1 Tax=Carnegiea gigantea TaxID=171969 RepID=A0A9Q1GTV1_9CARY|nr:hypothetical protein Cgig2_018857 [Carnegiea gigantea]